MKYNKNQRSNLKGLPLNRFENDIPKEMWVTEGEDYHSVKPKLTPYDTNIYDAIEYAIQAGIIDTGSNSKGMFDNDNDAVTAGLVDGDVYELSSTNTLTSDTGFNTSVTGLLKVVRQNVLIVANVLGAGTAITNSVLGTDIPNQILGLN